MKLNLLVAALDSEQYRRHTLHNRVQVIAKKPRFRRA
jgi:hypothetical protein